MPTKTQTASAVDFYKDQVAPALFERLDEAFPEFAWQWDGERWVSQNRRGQNGRAGEVVADGPEGFYVEDGEAMSWLAYVNGGTMPRGRGYHKAVEKLAALADLEAPWRQEDAEPDSTDRFTPEPDQRHVMETFFVQCRDALYSAAGAAARRMLHERWGFDPHALPQVPVGYYASVEQARSGLRAAGFTTEAIDASELAADARCRGRIVLAARDEQGRLMNFYARSMRSATDDTPVDLHLEDRPTPPAFGLEIALGPRSAGHDNLLIVRDRLDAVWFHWRGVKPVVAVSGWRRGLTSELWRYLAAQRVASVTLALDEEDIRRSTVLSAVEAAARVPESPSIFLLDPAQLGSHPTWQALARQEGTGSLDAAVARRVHAFVFLARAILRRHRTDGAWTEAARRSALAEAHRFCDSLPRQRDGELARYFWPTIHEAIPAEPVSVVHARIPKHSAGGPWQHEAYAPDEPYDNAYALPLTDWNAPATDGYDEPHMPAEAKPDTPATGAVRSVRDEWSEHDAYLRRNYRRGVAGLPQRTVAGLDECTQGLRGLMILAGEPSTGKTSLALQLATDVVMHNADACCIYVSLEMPRRRLITRLKSRLAGIDWRRLVAAHNGAANGYSGEHQWLRELRDAERDMAGWAHRMRILDGENCPHTTADEILRQLEGLKAQTGVARGLIVLDDLQAWSCLTDETSGAPHQGWHDVRRVDQLKQLRDAGGETAVLAVSEVADAAGLADCRNVDLARTIGSQRLCYAADMALLMRPWRATEIRARFDGQLYPSIVQARWQNALREQGITLMKLSIAKGREGVERSQIDLAFHYHRFNFSSQLPKWEAV